MQTTSPKPALSRAVLSALQWGNKIEAIKLVAAGEVRMPEHGYDDLAEDDIAVRELLARIGTTIAVEDYPDYPSPTRWNESFTGRRK